MNVQTEDRTPYYAPAVEAEDAVVQEALAILRRRLDRSTNPLFDSPAAVRDYLTLRIAGLEHEVFGVLWLDAQNRLIDADELFRGTLTQTAVYPREVAKQALARNAAGVVLYHNHPSGRPDPSSADKHITQEIKGALALLGTQVLDHFIVTANEVLSFAERGLI